MEAPKPLMSLPCPFNLQRAPNKRRKRARNHIPWTIYLPINVAAKKVCNFRIYSVISE